MTQTEYQTRRKAEAIPRWQEAFVMRKRGDKLREIAEKFATCPARVSRMIENYREHTLNQQIKQ